MDNNKYSAIESSKTCEISMITTDVRIFLIFLSYFFVKKIPLSRRVCHGHWSMDEGETFVCHTNQIRSTTVIHLP